MNFPLNKFAELSTPFYYYDLDLLKQTISSLKKASDKYGYVVHYAMKANANDKVLSVINESGLGADCVSGNEVKKAVEIGFKPDHIAFAGVGKSDKEIITAINANIFCFNCESLQEIAVIHEHAVRLGKKVNIALRINPNVDAHTHHYITTGLEENKFGISTLELDNVYKSIRDLSNINLVGIHFHIGSQIMDMSVFKSLCIKVNELQQWFNAHNVDLQHINVGGGLGVDYHDPDKNPMPDFEAYFNVFHQFLKLYPNQTLHFEIGRAIVAQCGSLISRVLFIKKGINTNFAILDAGMTELIRPALYQSYHKIENISQLETGNSKLGTQKYDVVGPICESSDCFGKAIVLPETRRGDLIVLRTAGAYGEVMASQYNLRDKVVSFYSTDSK